jgi:hypothetical protein
MVLAESAVRQALAFDPGIARAHMLLAEFILQPRGQYLEMEAESTQALALGDNDSSIHAHRAALLLMSGHLREMYAESQRAYAMAPADTGAIIGTAVGDWFVGRDAEFHQLTGLANSLAGGVPLAIKGADALRSRRYLEAGDFLSRIFAGQEVGPDGARTAEVIRLVFAGMADPAQRHLALEARIRLYPQSARHGGGKLTDATPCLTSAWSYAILGTLDVAYDLANQCLDQSVPGKTLITFPWTYYLWAPELRPFRRDPRFQALAVRLGLMPYWQKYGPPDECELTAGRLTCQ